MSRPSILTLPPELRAAVQSLERAGFRYEGRRMNLGVLQLLISDPLATGDRMRVTCYYQPATVLGMAQRLEPTGFTVDCERMMDRAEEARGDE